MPRHAISLAVTLQYTRTAANDVSSFSGALALETYRNTVRLFLVLRDQY
jgi:hypothetical protein